MDVDGDDSSAGGGTQMEEIAGDGDGAVESEEEVMETPPSGQEGAFFYRTS